MVYNRKLDDNFFFLKAQKNTVSARKIRAIKTFLLDLLRAHTVKGVTDDAVKFRTLKKKIVRAHAHTQSHHSREVSIT